MITSGTEASASKPPTPLSHPSQQHPELSVEMSGTGRFKALVCTGDRRGAGTTAKCFMALVDSTGKASKETKLDKIFFKDHQRGEAQLYDVSHQDLVKPDEIAYITVWRATTGSPDDSWFLDKIEVILF
jgi:PLAT/LH2 domain